MCLQHAKSEYQHVRDHIFVNIFKLKSQSISDMRFHLQYHHNAPKFVNFCNEIPYTLLTSSSLNPHYTENLKYSHERIKQMHLLSYDKWGSPHDMFYR